MKSELFCEDCENQMNLQPVGDYDYGYYCDNLSCTDALKLQMLDGWKDLNKFIP